MSILKKEAETLRASAARLEQAANNAPRNANQLIARFAPPSLRYRQVIELHYANDPDFVRHAIKHAGVEFGVEIGKTLQANFKGLRSHPYSSPFNPMEQALYEAEVYVFTTAQLNELVEKAIRAGRESA